MAINDLSVVVDLLNIVNQKAWVLDGVRSWDVQEPLAGSWELCMYLPCVQWAMAAWNSCACSHIFKSAVTATAGVIWGQGKSKSWYFIKWFCWESKKYVWTCHFLSREGVSELALWTWVSLSVWAFARKSYFCRLSFVKPQSPVSGYVFFFSGLSGSWICVL